MTHGPAPKGSRREGEQCVGRRRPACTIGGWPLWRRALGTSSISTRRLALTVMIYFVAGSQFHSPAVTSDALSGLSGIGELTADGDAAPDARRARRSRFSTLFKSGTSNYPVYLLSGIVFFNFFHEALSIGMASITGHAPLIKKVYMPKYIYPFSKLLSSLINFILSFIPLLLVMLATGTPVRASMLLLVFDAACLLGFVRWKR